jgi:hypothetical protein
MSSLPRVGDVGTDIIIDMGVAITGATNLDFAVRKPSYPATGGEESWTPTVYNTNYLLYIVKSGDFDEEGEYEIVPSLTLGGWSGSGDPVNFRVYGLRED